MLKLNSSCWRAFLFVCLAACLSLTGTAKAADFTAAIAGRVFCDANCNNVIDEGIDELMMKVQVQLYNSSGQLVATTTPEVYGGVYIFPDLVVGQSYTVKVVPAVGQTVINAFPSMSAVKLSTKTIKATVVQADTTYYPNDFLLKCCNVGFTQCDWGYDNCGFSPIDLIWCDFDDLFPSGLVIGGSKKFTFTNARAVLRFLPSSGTSKKLTFNKTNPYSEDGNRFAGNVLALALNLAISDKGITSECFGDQEITRGPLKGKTVREVLDIANKVLGGDMACPYGMSISDLNCVIDDINDTNCCYWNSQGCWGSNNSGYCQPRKRRGGC